MTSSFLTDAIIIAVVTAWFNLIFFFRTGAYCYYYRIPLDLVVPSVIDILFCSLSVLVPTGIIMLLISWPIVLVKNNIYFLSGFNSLTVIWVVGIILSCGMAYLLGYFKAKNTTVFVVIQENPKLVILYRTGENFLCKKYDEQTKQITEEMVLKKITDQPIFMKLEKLLEK